MKIHNPSGRLLGPVQVGEEIIYTWYYHYAVRIGNYVFDNELAPRGMHIEEYKKLFHYHEDLLFDPVEE